MLLRRRKPQVNDEDNLHEKKEYSTNGKNDKMPRIVSKNVEYYIYKKQVMLYAITMCAEVMTIRYNNDMYHYYTEFLQKNAEKVGCAYGVMKPITNKIREKRKIYILEMNNDKNKIMAIGRIAMISPEKAKAYHKKYYIYPKMSILEKYNRYLYFGNKRILRESMNETQEKVMQLFDTFCFKGNGNIKRGIGITYFPFHILYECAKIIDLTDFIDNMFL